MLVLGHTGITFGMAVLLREALARGYSLAFRTNGETEQPVTLPEASSRQDDSSASRQSRHLFPAGSLDIRLLLLGSLLPDIIDKPVGIYFFRDTVSSGRIIGHTLLFLFLITLAGLYLYRSKNSTGLLAFSFGTFTHLILDQMWLAPKTLLWPVFGFAFHRTDLTDWLPNILLALLRDPVVYIPELVGAAILAWFSIKLVRKRKIRNFLRNGRVL
jgi:membrane-bound metal-dependent hydrolase YbcI (DUF457 family)